MIVIYNGFRRGISSGSEFDQSIKLGSFSNGLFGWKKFKKKLVEECTPYQILITKYRYQKAASEPKS